MCIFFISFSYAVHIEPCKGRLLEPLPTRRFKGADVVMKLLGLAGLLRRGYHATAFSAQLN